jgi:hypothetical protein
MTWTKMIRGGRTSGLRPPPTTSRFSSYIYISVAGTSRYLFLMYFLDLLINLSSTETCFWRCKLALLLGAFFERAAHATK